MGRKSTEKSKLKKLKRKEESAKLAQKIALVNTANSLNDPMATLLPFKKFERNGLNLIVNCCRVKNLEKQTIDWAFQLTKNNMMRLYENSEWGWSDKIKREEMTHDNSWFLIAMDASSVAKEIVAKDDTSFTTTMPNINASFPLANGVISASNSCTLVTNDCITSGVNDPLNILASTFGDVAPVVNGVLSDGATVDNSNNFSSIANDVHTMNINETSSRHQQKTSEKDINVVAKESLTVASGLKSVVDSIFIDKNMKLVAMAHFRFDLENEEAVLYCYEIQLSPQVRRKGLGKFMMQTLELIAFKSEMSKVMLTTFKQNRSAQEFFKKLKYSLDDTNPDEDEDGEPCSYEIFSKPIGARPVEPQHGGGHVHTGCCHH